MKKFLLFLACFLLSFATQAQDEVYVKVTDVHNESLQKTMENNASRLLTAINKAQTRKSSSVDFSGIGLTEDAKDAILMLWENVHMRVVDDEIVARCLNLKSQKRTRGYEISNIAVEMIPMEVDYAGNRNQEITISFDLQGLISDLVISADMWQVAAFMKDAVDLDDLDRRMQILHYVEQFRTAYCQKDLKFMDNVFSPDALIITGRKVMRKSAELGMAAAYDYTKQNKEQYLSKLSDIFQNTKYVNVKFTDITIERNGARPNIYGVTCIQDWHSEKKSGGQYSDLGRVFMLWDFTDEDHPMIHVRTWQGTDDTKWFKTTDFKFN